MMAHSDGREHERRPRRRLVRHPSPLAGPRPAASATPSGNGTGTITTPEWLGLEDLVCRGEHPGIAKGKIQYRGRIHGVAFKVQLPDGYEARYVATLSGPGSEAMADRLHPGRMRLQCAHSDCHAVSVYDLVDNTSTGIVRAIATELAAEGQTSLPLLIPLTF